MQSLGSSLNTLEYTQGMQIKSEKELSQSAELNKPQMVHATTQTIGEIAALVNKETLKSTNEVATQTFFEETEEIQSETDEEDIFYDTLETLPGSITEKEPKYPLENIDFEVLQVTDGDISNLPRNSYEATGYLENAGKTNKLVVLGKVLFCVPIGIYRLANYGAKAIRPFFYETENELLTDICIPGREVRASESWFLPTGKGREVLYGLDHKSSFKTIFTNTPKWLWYEGITSIFTKERSAVLKFFKVFPHVYKERIEDIFKPFSKKVENLTKVAVNLLEDENYANEDYLKVLEANLSQTLDAHLKITSEFHVKKIGEVRTQLYKVQNEMFKRIDTHFLGGGQIDAIKLYAGRLFQVGQKIANDAIEGQEKALKEAASYLTDSIEDRKGRIHALLKELLKTRANFQKHLEEYDHILEAFDRVAK